MTDKPFVHLHVHTEYSLLDGLSKIKKLVGRAKELDMHALAITDHGTMFGVIDFYRACKEAEIKPIIGVEAYLSPRSMQDRDPKLDKRPYHMLLLAKNETGYRNLLKIASAGQLDGYYYRPRIDREFLAAHADGLVATSGCLAAQIPSMIINGRDDEARELVGWYQDAFGADNFFLELQQHDIPELETLNKWLVEYNRSHHTTVPLVATNDVHYVQAADYDPHDTLLCIQTSTLKSDTTRLRMSDPSYHLTSQDEMWGYFGKEVPEALHNTLKIAEMCDVNLDSQGYHLPVFPVPEGYDAASYLRYLCVKGLRWRYGEQAEDSAIQDRLERELGIIHQMGFDTYFLIVWDLCEFARHVDIWWNVRGSGAGSVAAYSLGITNIDPMMNNLLFERFLNPGRVSMPDIDLDYPDDRREEMIAYTARKYGEDKVASIITFGTMGAKAAVRDVGRALNVPLELVNQAARLIPTEPKPKPIIQYVEDNPELSDLYNSNAEIRRVIDTAKELQGVSRHASTHAAGVIVADRPLVEYIPLHRPTKGDTDENNPLKAVTQFTMETCESLGLLKVDFLGLSTLTIMRRACDLIERHHGIKYTMGNIPYRPTGDPVQDRMLKETFEMLGHGDTVGVFQVESSGMRQMLRDMRPNRFEHIVAGVSLYRPGPMEFIPTYNRRLHEEEQTEYRHHLLEPILGETFGICISGDSLVFDAVTGTRYRIDELEDKAGDFYIQGIGDDFGIAVGRVTHWMDNGTKDVYRLTLCNGASIKATSDHQFLTEQGWKELGDLKVGDYVATPPYLIEPETPIEHNHQRLRVLAYRIADGSCRSHEKFIPDFIFQLNRADTAFFLASLWDCDGYIGKKLCHYKTISEQLAHDVQTLLLKMGISSVIHRSRYTSTRGERTAYQVTVYDTAKLAAILQPHMLSVKKAVVCLGNAHNTVDRETFLAELKDATPLSNRGIMAEYGIDRQHLNATGRDRERIAVHVVRDITQTLALSATSQHSQVVWEAVTSIEPAGAETVYDLTVAGLHNFVANNIVVHNCVYQEQIMQIAQQLFGYELGEADLMRRAVSKKKEKDLQKHRDIFLERGPEHGVDVEAAGKIFDDIEFFANYGFNKSHAADYAVITCQTAYLKCHYPAEYMTALLSVHRDDTTKITTFLGECRRLGIPVLPPDVNHSALDFDIQTQPDGKRGVRFGLAAIKNAGAAALQPIIDARNDGGSFKNLEDFCRRVDLRMVQKRTLESLVRVGALRAFGKRAVLLAALDRLLSFSADHHKAKEVGQMNLFGESSGFADELLYNLPNLEEVHDREMLNWEKELLGFYVTGRPTDKFQEILEHAGTTEVNELIEAEGSVNGRMVKIAGEVVTLRKIVTRNNEIMGVATMEDWHPSAGSIDVVLFPRTWTKFQDIVAEGQVIIASGKADTGRGDLQVICESVTNNANSTVPDEAPLPYTDADIPPWMLDENYYDEETGEVAQGEAPPPPPPPVDEVAPATLGAAAVPIPATEPQLAPAARPHRPGDEPDWMNGESETITEPSPFEQAADEQERWLMIYFKRSEDAEKDRRRLRRLHGILTKYPGNDRFTIVVEGMNQSFHMEFPNHTTAYCESLVNDLLSIVGETNIQVFDRPQ